MPESITPLLAEQLDISEEQARSLLKTMVQELRQRTETDAVQLSGLGTFHQDDGTLVFQPGPSLRRRVNRQFEGLSAEPLTPVDAEPEAAPSPGQSASGPTDTPESTDPEPPPFMQSPPAPDEPDEATEASASAAASEGGETSDAQDRPPADRGQADDGSPDSFTVISLALLVLFLLGAGWFVLDRANVWGPSSPTASSPSTTQSPTASTEPSAAADSEDPSEAAESPSEDAQDATDAPAQETESPAQNWTIIVASRSSRSAAQEVADAYTPRFDSVAVVAGTVDNTTWYRVAIGRYSSEADAEQALADQSDALPSDAWTHRLR
jgi:septal ring-binding cell division protein DamX